MKQGTLYYSLITLSLGPRVNRHTMSLNNKLSYNTSFLNCDQVIIDGDIGSNPGDV